MLLSSTILVCIVMSMTCCGNANCLSNRIFFTLMEQILRENANCTALLLNLDSVTNNAVSANANTPMVILNSPNNKHLDKIRDLLSARQTKCAILFAQEDTLDEGMIEHILNQTTHRNVFVLQGVTNALKLNFSSYFKDSIKLVHLPTAGDNLLITNYAHTKEMIWLKSNQAIVTSDPEFTLSKNSARSTLRGKNVIVSAVPIAPFVKILANKRYGGAEMDIMKIVSEKIGFQFQVKVERVPQYIDRITKRWRGSAGSVVDGTSQFAVTITEITGFGVPCPVYFPQPMGYEKYNYLVPKPKPLKPFSNFVRPFELSVWLCFAASFILCSILAIKLRHGETSLRPDDIVFQLFGTIWQQNLKSTLVSPNSGTYFLLFGFWIMGMFFKGAAYNCNIRACMIKIDFEAPIDTDEDILASNIDLYIPSGQGFVEEFQNSASPAKRALYDRVIKRSTEFPIADGSVTPNEERMVKEGGGRFINRGRNSFILAVYEKHFGYQALRATKGNAFERCGGTVMPLYQPWTDEVDVIIFHLIDAGIPDFLLRKNSPPQKSTSDDDEDVLEPYQVDHLAGPLAVLGSGLMLSLIVFCLELMHHTIFA